MARLLASPLRAARCWASSIAAVADTAAGVFVPRARAPLAAPVREGAEPISSALAPANPCMAGVSKSAFEIKILDFAGKDHGVLRLSPAVFGEDERTDIIHRVVRWQLNKRRVGLAKTLTRAEVSGSNRKLYRQKGTGKARTGPARKAPHKRGGGVAFGKQPRSFATDLPKAVRAFGLRAALSNKYAANSLYVLKNLELDSHKTKDLAERLAALGLTSALFVDVSLDMRTTNMFWIASRNLHAHRAIPPVGLNVYDMIKRPQLVLTPAAIVAIEARAQRKRPLGYVRPVVSATTLH